MVKDKSLIKHYYGLAGARLNNADEKELDELSFHLNKINEKNLFNYITNSSDSINKLLAKHLRLLAFHLGKEIPSICGSTINASRNIIIQDLRRADNMIYKCGVIDNEILFTGQYVYMKANTGIRPMQVYDIDIEEGITLRTVENFKIQRSEKMLFSKNQFLRDRVNMAEVISNSYIEFKNNNFSNAKNLHLYAINSVQEFSTVKELGKLRREYYERI